MDKPEVRIIEDQTVSSEQKIVSQSEIDYLLSKYGYVESIVPNMENNHSTDLAPSFEEMIRLEEERIRQRQNYENQMRNNRPKAFTFDDVNYHESKYSSLDIEGANLGIQVTITSDMNIYSNNPRRS